MIVGAPQLLKAWRYDPEAPENLRYYGVPTAIKVEYGVLYLGMALLLGIMSFEVHDMLAHVRRVGP